MIAMITGHQLALLLPWDALCSDNRKYMNRRFTLSPQYRKSKQLIAKLARLSARAQKWKVTREPLEIEVRIIEPDRRRRDLNFSKNLKDGISASGAIWKDDCQVRRETWELLPTISKNLAGAVVHVRIYQPTQPETSTQKESV